MTDAEQLEGRLGTVNNVIGYLENRLEVYTRERDRLTGLLRRARRLEREELQNGKQQG